MAFSNTKCSHEVLGLFTVIDSFDNWSILPRLRQCRRDSRRFYWPMSRPRTQGKYSTYFMHHWNLWKQQYSEDSEICNMWRNPPGYRAPVILAEEVERLIPTFKGAKILDIGAGKLRSFLIPFLFPSYSLLIPLLFHYYSLPFRNWTNRRTNPGKGLPEYWCLRYEQEIAGYIP